MPPNNILGLDDSNRIQNGGEHSAQPDEDQPIDVLCRIRGGAKTAVGPPYSEIGK